MGTTRNPGDNSKEEERRAKEHDQQVRTDAFYNSWRKQNQGAKWRVLGSEGEPDPDDLKKATLTRGDGPIDPKKPMGVGFLRRVDAEKNDFSDLYSDGKSLTAFNRGKLFIKADDIAADIKNMQDCWASQGVGKVVIDNKVPNRNVLDGIMQRLQTMKDEHPPRAIVLGQHIIEYIHSEREMKNGKVSPKWEKLLELATQSQDNYQKYMDSKVSKHEAKEAGKSYEEITEKLKDPDKFPPAPATPDDVNDMVEKVLKKDTEAFAPVKVEDKLARIEPEIEKLEKRADELDAARKQLLDQAKTFDETLKKEANPAEKKEGVKFEEANGIRIRLEKEEAQRNTLIIAIEREQKQIDAMRGVWQQELKKPGYPDPSTGERPLSKQAGLVDNLQSKLSALEKRAADAKPSAELRADFDKLKNQAAVKAEELQSGGPVPRKPR